MPNASQTNASSSGPQDPKGPQDGGNLEFAGEMIDADVVEVFNVELRETANVQSRLQHALAAPFLRHRPSETIEPPMLRIFRDTFTPKQYATSPKDTLSAMLMHENFEIPVLTTREAVGKTTPSKHEISYGKLPKYNTVHMFAEEADECLRDHYKFLESVLSTHPKPIIRG